MATVGGTLARRGAVEDRQALLQKWADGKASLKDVQGYSEEELFTIAKLAYLFYYQGKLDEARTLYQGLYALNPGDPYVAKALGVVELAAGNAESALQAYEVALKLSPQDAAAYVGRAEAKISLGQNGQAVDDLRRAADLSRGDRALNAKVSAMLGMIRKK